MWLIELVIHHIMYNMNTMHITINKETGVNKSLTASENVNNSDLVLV